MAPLLRLLRERSIKVGVLSNTVWPRALHERVFRRDGVLELIDGAVYSSEIAWTKPHPEAFLAAMAAIGVSDPSSCVFVGDRPFDDIYGAARLGMRTVFIPHSGLPPYEGAVPDAVISRLAELPGLLDRWLEEGVEPGVEQRSSSRLSSGERIRDVDCRPAGARYFARGRAWLALSGGLGDAAGGREQEGRLPAALLGRVLGGAVRVERGRGLLARGRVAGGRGPADAGPADASDGGEAGVFGHASGLGLFSAASQRLTEAGVRVPRVYLTDASLALYPADIALVEDVRGGTLEELLAADPAAAAPVMERLGEMLRSMWGRRAARVGRVADVAETEDVGVGRLRRLSAAGAPAAPGPSSEGIVLERALRQLGGAADRVPSVAAVRPRLDETLRALAASVRPRASYGLIHGELGPDHVSIDDRGQPVVVDIEGAMYFDVEWEHAFLRLRFGRDYEWLRVSGLDEHRMSLYALALDLSLIEGPLRLLDGDYPDREEMLAIAGWAVDRVLRTADGDR